MIEVYKIQTVTTSM